MSDKEKIVIEAAMEIISRYGIRRTTMGDIAEKAGISRQTLYSICSNKEEVLAKVIKQSAENTLAKIRSDWEEDLTLAEKLDVYFEHAVIKYFDLLQKMPDANDLISDLGQIDSEEFRQVEEKKMEALAGQFEPYAEKLNQAGSSPADMADFIMRSSANFKHAAQDRKHLQRLLASLKASSLPLSTGRNPEFQMVLFRVKGGLVLEKNRVRWIPIRDGYISICWYFC